jgi:CHAT domain-containing protein
VAFCVCNFGSLAFIVGREPGNPIAVVELPDFDQNCLRQLLSNRSDGLANDGGWLTTFRRLDPDAWRAAIDRVLRSVGERLLKPVIKALPAGVEHLLLLPSGGLGLLPLHAALLSDNPLRRVCDRFLVSYAPSAQALLDSRRGAASTGGLYQVVNPTEDVHLPYAAVEAAAVGGLIADHLAHCGSEATKSAVAAGARGRTLIHFVCHGWYDWAEPLLSGLKLAAGDLTLADLQAGALDMTSASLVVLSACETGITDVSVGSPDEYVGLPAGFLLAGAPCLVSSLWKVADISTALFMEHFFRQYLAKRCDAVRALSEAQQWLRDLPATAIAAYAERCLRSTALNAREASLIRQDAEQYRRLAERSPEERPFAHPYYWAAFTVTGG